MRLKNFPALCLAILAACAACAADPVPAKDTEKALPLSDPSPVPAAPPSLLPDEIPRALNPKKGYAPPETKPGIAKKPKLTAEDMDLRVRYRKARNIAEGIEQVRTAWEYSRYPKTEEEKRRALRHYYDLLFSQMIAMDRGIAPLVEKSRKAQAAALTQMKIAPTVPNE